MNTHIDTLRDWWNDAERGAAHEGDTVIYHDGSDDMYQVYTLGTGQVSERRFIRILHRAPKPKPAWHDAVAVTATATDELGDEITAVWVREGDELWCSEEGGTVLRDDLRDVSPLIEAKVTQVMLDRARAESMKWDFGGLSENAVNAVLDAALNIDPE